MYFIFSSLQLKVLNCCHTFFKNKFSIFKFWENNDTIYLFFLSHSFLLNRELYAISFKIRNDIFIEFLYAFIQHSIQAIPGFFLRDLIELSNFGITPQTRSGGSSLSPRSANKNQIFSRHLSCSIIIKWVDKPFSSSK